MKMFLRWVLFFLLTNPIFSQENDHDLILGLGSGGGVTFWQLHQLGAVPYYENGGQSVPIQLETFYRYNWLRVGMGVSFEQLFIDSLKSWQPYQTGFRFKDKKVGFSKIYLQLEAYPIYNSHFILGLMGNVGVYRLDNQFKQDEVIKSILFSGGIVGEYLINNNVRLYINPVFQFKYFEFTVFGIPQDIQNKIGTGLLIVGFKYLVD